MRESSCEGEGKEELPRPDQEDIFVWKRFSVWTVLTNFQPKQNASDFVYPRNPFTPLRAHLVCEIFICFIFHVLMYTGVEQASVWSFTWKQLLPNIPHSGVFGLCSTAEQYITLQKPTWRGKVGLHFDMWFLCLFGFSYPKAFWTLGSSYAVIALLSSWSCLTHCCLSWQISTPVSFLMKHYSTKRRQLLNDETPPLKPAGI